MMHHTTGEANRRTLPPSVVGEGAADAASRALGRSAPHVSRRRFIATSAVAAGAAWLFPSRPVRAGSDEPELDFGGFRVGIQSNVLNAFSPELEPMIGHVADLGLRWIEFARWHYDVTDDADRIAQVQAWLQRHELRMEGYFLGEIEADADQLRRTFEFARNHGVSVLIGQPTQEAFPILDALVREFEIKVAVHNYGPGHRFDRIQDLLIAVAPWDWRIGFCLDPSVAEILNHECHE
jgi:inosose dehydratase